MLYSSINSILHLKLRFPDVTFKKKKMKMPWPQYSLNDWYCSWNGLPQISQVDKYNFILRKTTWCIISHNILTAWMHTVSVHRELQNNSLNFVRKHLYDLKKQTKKNKQKKLISVLTRLWLSQKHKPTSTCDPAAVSTLLTFCLRPSARAHYLRLL